jgi:hypothetical protein
MKIIRNFEPLTIEQVGQRWEKHLDSSRQDWAFLGSEDVIIGDMNDHLVSQLTFYYETPTGKLSKTRKVLREDYYFSRWAGQCDHINQCIDKLIDWNKKSGFNAESLEVSVDLTFNTCEDPHNTMYTFTMVKEGEAMPLTFAIPCYSVEPSYIANCAKKALGTIAWKKEVLKHHPDTVFSIR